MEQNEKGILELSNGIAKLINECNQKYDLNCGDVIQALCIINASLTEWVADSMNGKTQEEVFDDISLLTKALIASSNEAQE